MCILCKWKQDGIAYVRVMPVPKHTPLLSNGVRVTHIAEVDNTMMMFTSIERVLAFAVSESKNVAVFEDGSDEILVSQNDGE